MTDDQSKITLKPLRPEDLEAVIAIDKAGSSSATSRRGYFEKRLAAATEHPKDYIFVGLFADGSLTGFAFAKLVTGAFGQSGATASLDSIGVDPAHGQQGYGHKLLQQVQAVLRQKGVSTLTSQIEWKSQDILSFMAREGFELAPQVVLNRKTTELVFELEDLQEQDETDHSSPDGDAENALSHDSVPVRTMTENDLAKMVSIDTANTGQDRASYYARKQNEFLHQSGVQVSLVAEQEGFVVGFIMARVDFGEFGRTSAEAVMDTLAVDPGYQGQSIGHTLMAKLLAHLRNLEVETVRTEVTWNDTRLIDFFSSLGFEPAQRVALYKHF